MNMSLEIYFEIGNIYEKKKKKDKGKFQCNK